MRKNLYASENSVLYTQLLTDYIAPEFSPIGENSGLLLCVLK